MSDDIFKAGDRFEKYVVVRQIGKGGQGEVYLSRHAFTNKRVAIKVLPVRKSTRSDYRERLAREARVMGTVEHPNIVAIYDGGFTGENTVFIVMEYLDGLLLRDLIFRQGCIDLKTALTYGCSITGAIAALHRAEILHRDLKPENVFVLVGGIIKVIDFGLARLRDNAARTTVRLPNGDKPGIMGTPHYMSPEQLLGEGVGEKADVYAIGLIFYEMVTGKHVFQLMTDEFPTLDAVTIQHHVTVPRLLGDVAAGVPEDLSRLIARCLAKDPAERPTAAELGEGLRAILERLQRGAERAPSSRPRAVELAPVESAPAESAPEESAPAERPIAPALAVHEPSAPPSVQPPGRAMPPRLDTVPLPPGYRPQDPSTWTVGGADPNRKERAALPYATTEELAAAPGAAAANDVAREAVAPPPWRGNPPDEASAVFIAEPAAEAVPAPEPAETLPGVRPAGPVETWAPWVPYKDPYKERIEGRRSQRPGALSDAPQSLQQAASLPPEAASPSRGGLRVETLEPITTVRARRSRSRVKALLSRPGPIAATGVGLGLSLMVFFVAMVLWRTASPKSDAEPSAAEAASASASAPVTVPATASATATVTAPVSASASASASVSAPVSASAPASEPASSAAAPSTPPPTKRATTTPKPRSELPFPNVGARPSPAPTTTTARPGAPRGSATSPRPRPTGAIWGAPIF